MTDARSETVARIAAMAAEDPAELAAEFIDHVQGRVDYWAALPHVDRATGRTMTIRDRCEGVAFSILLAIDEAMWLVSERGTVLNDSTELHSSLVRRPHAAGAASEPNSGETRAKLGPKTRKTPIT